MIHTAREGADPTISRVLVSLHDACHSRRTGSQLHAIAGPLSFDLREGELLSIVGPEGSGKTTLIKMIAGLLKVTAGEIRFDPADAERVQRSMGLAFEQPSLLPWRTAMQNILLQAELRGLDREESRNRARRLMSWFGLTDYEDRRPHEIPAAAAPLISVCRAMVHDPPVLLMDEPFRSLNALTLEHVLDAFQRLWLETRSTVLLCTSNLHEAVFLADRVAVLSPGPGTILQILPVNLPRPRRFDKAMSPRIAEYCSLLRTLFRAQGVLP